MSGDVASSGTPPAGTQPTEDSANDSSLLNAPPECWGCHKPIDGGSAIQFADGVWHIDCFQCTTCSKVIEFDSNLLFLADGKPICPECSYCCSLCKKPIFDEAIVTVEGTYHSECFRCTNCKQRIQGKSFAKTSQGVIYCVTCYAERRERKKAARRRREHQVLEEKMLPSLPTEAAANEEVMSAKSIDSNANSHTPLTSSTIGSTMSSAQQQQQQHPVSAGALGPATQLQKAGGASGGDESTPEKTSLDVRTRRRGVHNSADFAGNPEAANAAEGGGAADNGLSLLLAPRGMSAGNTVQSAALTVSSAPSTPVKSEGEIPAVPLTLANLNAADPSLDLGLAWTEDINALENNFVRSSMRTPLIAKQPSPKSPEGTSRKRGSKQKQEPKSLSRSSSVNRGQQRSRAASSASALGSLVPPGLRSRDNSSNSTGTSSQKQKHQSGPIGDATNDASLMAEGKEWLNTATVEQLKDELLVNYGQLCRMEASYQKLRDLYASVIDQLLQTRETLQQERSKRQELEGILRNFYGYVATDSGAGAGAGDSGTVKHSSRHRGAAGGASAAAASGQILAGRQQKARGHMSKPKADAGSAPSMSRQPSVRRQRHARPQEAAHAADHNDSGSEDDAIITTVPQKATKRFIWPFGGGGGGGGGAGSRPNGDDAANHHDHGAANEDHVHHSFHVTSTFRTSKCDHCQERLKTFSNSVVRCRNCGFVCHQRCAADVTASCSSGDSGRVARTAVPTAGGGTLGANNNPALYDPSVAFHPDKMFGRDLCEQAALEGQNIPWVVRSAIEFIEAQGLTMEGVYRRSGSTMDIRAVLIEVSNVAEATNNKFHDAPIAPPSADVTSVTSVLKQYFRDLPNPLMTSDTYHLWVHTASIASVEERIKVYRTISDSMPTAHSETLRYLMTHLKRVANNQQENKMTTNNLSVVFAPNILHMGKGDMLQEMANMSNINKTVSFLIQYAEDIWGESHYEKYSNGWSSVAANDEAGNNADADAMATASLVPETSATSVAMPSAGAGGGNNSTAGPFKIPPTMKRQIDARVINSMAGDENGDLFDHISFSHSMPSPKGLFFGQHEPLPSDHLSRNKALNNDSAAVYQKSSFDLPRNK
ncbi:Rho-type gtpase-activating protein [Coemansia sp. RSA 2598]|nr:Rho-type gtpase-activating protein [Coemansia sp. RSA 2598]